MGKADPLLSRAVGRKRTKKFADGETMSITFKIDAETARALDREADRLTEEMGFPVSRVAVMRAWLKEAAERRRKK